MCSVLIVDADDPADNNVEARLRRAGHCVIRASSTTNAIQLLEHRAIDLVLAGRHIDKSLKAWLLDRVSHTPLILVGEATPDIVAAIDAATFGLRDCLDFNAHGIEERPPHLSSVPHPAPLAAVYRESSNDIEPHATARWARAVVGVIDSPMDPRTLSAWGRWIGASPGAIRNWCHTAGLPPRKSLLLARMLRACFLIKDTTLALPDLLDVVDRRTLVKMLRFAGFADERALPRDIDSFLRRQALVREPLTLKEIERALRTREFAYVTPDGKLPAA